MRAASIETSISGVVVQKLAIAVLTSSAESSASNGVESVVLVGVREENGVVLCAEVGLHALEGGDAGVEAGELGFEFGDDAALFGERR